MNNRRNGFTLIELLVVITIMMMLMTLLLPAIFRAKTWVIGIMVKGRITALTNACNGYYQIFDAYPGVIDNPPNPPQGWSPNKISGTQNLILALFGCSRDQSTKKYSAEVRGPCQDIDRYNDVNFRKYEPFFNAKPGELISQAKAIDPNSPDDTDVTIPKVIVDYLLSPPRPLLYYRALPLYVNSRLYEFDDNAVYCVLSKGENEGNFNTVITSAAKKSAPGFIIISAGPNRVYDLTAGSDDLSNVAN